MKTKSFTSFGSLHPILFFAGVYIVALLASVFICSSLFYSCNASSSGPSPLHSKKIQSLKGADRNNAVVYR